MLDIEKMKAAALAAKDKWSFEPSYADFIATANPSAVLELIARLEAGEWIPELGD